MSYAYLQHFEDKACPLSLKIYGASDYATMEVEQGKRDPDFTEHGIIGIDHIGDWWVLDWYFKQCQTDVGIKAFIAMIKKHKPRRWWNEGGSIDKAIAPTIRAEMKRAQSFVSIEAMPSIDDKSMKAQAFHAVASAGTVHFPLRRKWVDHVMDQLVKFPGGKHDDAVDVLGLLGRGVDKMQDASLPFVAKRDILVPFTAKWLETNYATAKPPVRYF